ncbi:farnesyl-diphosphate farnesyltransferase [Paraburkholderia steynii]|uniref:Farnesyl-diphosphate farnesyltransferase n=1 Tax=Paraburkholderia steynii TaxID=1245441 RepID=A0A4R0XBR1_9BURK|nr:farnesyl-diphosphate farnesyltransferase [Paraburkholderia steynii]
MLGPLLKGVSRSFYLTLRILPAGMRDPIGLAYLLARAADTIADTALIRPSSGLRCCSRCANRSTARPTTASLRSASRRVAGQQTQSDEKVLLESIAPALDVLQQLDAADRAAVREIVTTLTTGMEFDLRTFPDERSGRIVALREWDELDRYTYLVAGCVGEFWTKMTYAHLPGTLKTDEPTMLERGVRFGKALQMTNVLRDCGKDLRIGRCYLPSTMLDRYGMTPQMLLEPQASQRAQPLMHELVRKSLDHFRAALDYTLAIPRFSLRLRLACVWPIVIGLETLLLLVDNAHWLEPAKVSKIQRKQVYGILARSLPVSVSDAGLRSWIEGLIRAIESRIGVR